MNLFAEEIEQTAIERIQKFSKIAKAMGFEVKLGFSGGKDSQVCYASANEAGLNSNLTSITLLKAISL